MERRLALSALLAAAGLVLLVLAQLPPGLPGHYGRPWNHVAVDGQVLGNTPEDGTVALRVGYVFDGSRHEQTFHDSSRITLPDGRVVADLKPGDGVPVFVDPSRPGGPDLRPERWLGIDAPQILLGLALLAAAVVNAFVLGGQRRA